MVLVDLNANLDSPRGRQKDVLAAEASKHGLACAAKYCWCQQKRRHMHGRWTFLRPTYTSEGERRWIHRKPDYALKRARDRRHVRIFVRVAMQHHNSNYQTLVMRVETDLVEVKRYKKE